MSRNRALELHRMQFTNKPIGSAILVGQNPRNKKFPRHGKYTERIPKKMYFKQANNGFMIMGQPTVGPSLDMESVKKTIDGMVLRATAERIPQRVTQRLDDQVLNKLNELGEKLEKIEDESRMDYGEFRFPKLSKFMTPVGSSDSTTTSSQQTQSDVPTTGTSTAVSDEGSESATEASLPSSSEASGEGGTFITQANVPMGATVPDTPMGGTFITE